MLAVPGYQYDSRIDCPGHKAGKRIASGMTERGAGAVRCNDLLGRMTITHFPLRLSEPCLGRMARGFCGKRALDLGRNRERQLGHEKFRS